MDAAAYTRSAFGIANDPAGGIACRNRSRAGQAFAGFKRDCRDLPRCSSGGQRSKRHPPIGGLDWKTRQGAYTSGRAPGCHRLCPNLNLSPRGHRARVRRGGKSLPALAQVQGEYLGRLLSKYATVPAVAPPFRFRNRGNTAVIGRHAAVFDFGRWQMKGRLAWGLWAVIHVYLLINSKSAYLSVFNGSGATSRGNGERYSLMKIQGSGRKRSLPHLWAISEHAVSGGS